MCSSSHKKKKMNKEIKSPCYPTLLIRGHLKPHRDRSVIAELPSLPAHGLLVPHCSSKAISTLEWPFRSSVMLTIMGSVSNIRPN